MKSRSFHALPLLLIAALALTTAGCDSNEDKDDSDFAVLEGEWNVTAFTIDDLNLESRLNSEYEDGVTITFSEDDDTGVRLFDFFATVQGSGENRRAGGTLVIDSGNGVLFFDPNTGDINLPFQLDYEIENFTEVDLVASSKLDGGAVLRNFLLPGATIGSQYPNVRLTIERPADSVED